MGANYFLIPVAIVAAAIVVAINLYVLVHFQHPNDRNQSYFPKLVVVLGLRCVLYTGPHTTALAMWTPILKDFARRISPPTPPFQYPPSAPFNSN